MRLITCPKPFASDAGELQLRALANWRALGAEIVFSGPGTDLVDAPEGRGLLLCPVEGRAEISKMPLFADLVDALNESEENSERRIHVYLNADILLPEAFSRFREENGTFYYGAAKLPPRFLITGCRWDLREGIVYEGSNSESSLADFVVTGEETGEVTLHDETAMDYFIFPAGLFAELPPTIVGRGGYDNALLAFCMRRGIPVIDGSREWVVLHQFHGYPHKPGGKQEVYLGEEAMFNRRSNGILRSLPNSLDADYCLERGRIVATPWRCGVWRRFELTARFRLGASLLGDLFRAIQRLFGCHLRTSRREMAKTRRAIANYSGSSIYE